MWAMDLVASTQYGTASFDGATGPQSALDNLVELCLCAVAERLHGGARDQWCQGADWAWSPGGGCRNRCTGARVPSGCDPDSDDGDCAGRNARQPLCFVAAVEPAPASGVAVAAAAVNCKRETIAVDSVCTGDRDACVADTGMVDASHAASSSLRADFPRLRIFALQNVVETGVKALAEIEGQFEDTIVCHENDDVACGVDDGGADFAVSQMAFDIRTNLGIERVVDIFGDAVPNVAAA